MQNTLNPLISGPGNVPSAKTVLERQLMAVFGMWKNYLRTSEAIWRNNFIHYVQLSNRSYGSESDRDQCESD